MASPPDTMKAELDALRAALEASHDALRAWDAAVTMTREDGVLKWRWTSSKLQHAFALTRVALHPVAGKDPPSTEA